MRNQMNSQLKKTHHTQHQPTSLAHCKHAHILTYELSANDQADFCRRLDLVLKQNGANDSLVQNNEFSLNFLTPSIRGQRAKSMLATTRDSKNNVQSTISNINEWSPEDQLLTNQDDQMSSIQKYRSNSRRPTKGKSRLPAPQVFRNCAQCGAFFINEDIVAVKPRQYCFRSEILPSQLICVFFEMQGEKRTIMQRDDINPMSGQDVYLQGRKRIIDGVYKMGVKFRQARETIHIAIEMIDQYYLSSSQEMSAKAFKVKLMHAAAVILHQVTVLLIASKFDEIDDNITAIQDLREYVQKQVSHQQRRDFSLLPSFEQIVECERKLLVFFEWDLKFVLPLHVVRAYLANGVLFSNEFQDLALQEKTQTEISRLKAEWSRSITTESLSISDLIVSKGNVTYRSESSSDIAASIVYLARKNILEADSPDGKSRVPQIWPQELVMITRCTELKAKRILVDVLRPLEQQVVPPKKDESQQQYQSVESQRGVTRQQPLTDHKSSYVVQKSATQRNLLTEPKNQNVKVAEQVPTTEFRATEKQLKKDLYPLKLSVLGQQRNAAIVHQSDSTNQSATKVHQSQGKVVNLKVEEVNASAPVTDRAQHFIANYQSNKQQALDQREQNKAVTYQQKTDKSKHEGHEQSTEKQGAEGIAKSGGSFSEMSQVALKNIRQAQSQRQLFQSTVNTGARNYQQSVMSAETIPIRCDDKIVSDHLLQPQDDYQYQTNSGITKKEEFEVNCLNLTETDEDDESDTAEVTYYNDMKRRSTQPCVKQTLPSINGATRTVIQTCEKPKESSSVGMGGPPLSERTFGSTTVANEICGILNPKPSVASVSSLQPTEISGLQPFSSSRRPKNELGFQDETNVSKPTEEQQQKTPFAVPEVEEEAQESDGQDDSKEIPIARSSDHLPKPKPQPTLSKAKKAQPQQQQQVIAKQKYLDIKRAQMAKKLQRTLKQPVESGGAGGENIEIVINSQGACSENTRNGAPPFSSDRMPMISINGQDSSRAAPAPAQQQNSISSNTAREQLRAQQSNEYFSVRPKMMDHANQLAIQSDILRSSSIEYESHMTNGAGSDYSSILPTDFASQKPPRRWTVRNANNGQSNQQSKVQVPQVPGQLVKQSSDSSNGTQAKLAASQISFFKRESQRSMISNNSAVKNKDLASNAHTKSNNLYGDPVESYASMEHLPHEHSEGHNAIYSSQQNIRESQTKSTNAYKLNAHMLPSIVDRKPQTATNQVTGQQQLNFDFSSQPDRFAQKPGTAKNSQQILTGRNSDVQQQPQPQQQVKYLTKTSGLHGLQRNKGKEPTITATQGLLRSTNHAQSMRHMQPNVCYEESNSNLQLMSSQSGISKTKSSIFGGNNASSTATKSINGFGNSGANGGHPPQTSSHYQHQQQASSSKGFCANKIRKGPSFNQMSYIATPTSAIESSASKLIRTAENGSGSIGVHHERQPMKLGTQQTVNFNQMLNFKQNLIQASGSGHQSSQSHQSQQQLQAPHSSKFHHHRNGSQSKAHQNSSKSSQLLQQNSSSGKQQHSSTRFSQHSNTLKQVAADEALANLRNAIQNTGSANHGHYHSQVNPEQLGSSRQHIAKSHIKDPQQMSQLRQTSSNSHQMRHSSSNSQPQLLPNSFENNSSGGHHNSSSHLRPHHSHRKQMQASANNSSQKKESQSSRLHRQMPSNMMPSSQPMYGNKRNHGGNHLANGHLHNKSNKLLTVEQNKPSSFLAGQQQQMASHQQLAAKQQMIPGKSYDNKIGSRNNNGGRVAVVSPEQPQHYQSQQNILTVSNGSSVNGYQNLRLRTLKQTSTASSNQLTESKH